MASATNDHRLGANEAPPAIISIFLGEQLADVFEQIAKGAATSSKGKGTMIIGVDTLPPLPTDPGDRNRTSPFAFTGNRFEFRAPGSGQTVAVPLVVLNTIMADSLDYMATVLEKAVADGGDFDSAVQKLLTEIITEHGAVVYNGDGYSEKWQIEAAQRGLPNLKTTLDAIPELIKPEVGRTLREIRRVQRARAAQPLRGPLGAVRADRRGRGQAGAGTRDDGRSCRPRSATRPSWPRTSRR